MQQLFNLLKVRNVVIFLQLILVIHRIRHRPITNVEIVQNVLVPVKTVNMGLLRKI